MIKVYAAANPLQAHLVRGLLEEHGIESSIQGEALWAARGELPFTPETSPSLFVRAEDAEAARVVIEEFEASRKDLKPDICPQCKYDLRGSPGPRCPECGMTFEQSETWTCTCGEEIEGQFTDCWKCGAERDHISA